MSCKTCIEQNAKYEPGFASLSKGYNKRIAVCYRCPDCGEGYCRYKLNEEGIEYYKKLKERRQKEA